MNTSIIFAHRLVVGISFILIAHTAFAKNSSTDEINEIITDYYVNDRLPEPVANCTRDTLRSSLTPKEIDALNAMSRVDALENANGITKERALEIVENEILPEHGLSMGQFRHLIKQMEDKSSSIDTSCKESTNFNECNRLKNELGELRNQGAGAITISESVLSAAQENVDRTRAILNRQMKTGAGQHHIDTTIRLLNTQMETLAGLHAKNEAARKFATDTTLQAQLKKTERDIESACQDFD